MPKPCTFRARRESIVAVPIVRRAPARRRNEMRVVQLARKHRQLAFSGRGPLGSVLGVFKWGRISWAQLVNVLFLVKVVLSGGGFCGGCLVWLRQGK